MNIQFPKIYFEKMPLLFKIAIFLLKINHLQTFSKKSGQFALLVKIKPAPSHPINKKPIGMAMDFKKK